MSRRSGGARSGGAPTDPLDKGSYYRVTITTAATDLVGNPLQSGTTWRFKAAPK